MSELPDSALRPLRAARDAVEVLRSGAVDPQEARAAFLRTCDAIEASLRRLIRDDSTLPLELRLRALAPEELSVEEVVTQLRQRDRISIELAAAFHDLLAVRRRMLEGAPVQRGDAELAGQVVGRLEHEVGTMRPVEHASAIRPAPPEADASYPDEVERPRSLVAGSVRQPARVWVLVAVAAIFLIGAAVWWGGARRESALEQGVELFRSGDLDGAAVHLERHTAAHPEDVTARLYLARIYRRTGDFERAREELRHAIEVAPDDAALHRELGFLLLDTGRADNAVGRFRSAVELDPASTEGWVGLVRALRATGQAGAAERVIARAPAEVRALLRTSSPGTP